MAKKKKDLNEENIDNQEEFNDIDENFGLPDVEFNPLDEESSTEEETPEEASEEVQEVVQENDWSYSEDSSHSVTEENEYSYESEVENADEPEGSFESDSFSAQEEGQDDYSESGEEKKTTYVPGSYTPPHEEKSKAPTIVAIVLIVIVALGTGWYFGMYMPEQKAIVKAKQEKIAKQKAEAERKQKYNGLIARGDEEFGKETWEEAKSSYTSALALFPNEQYPKEQIETINVKLAEIAEANAKPKIGTIETISAPTSRYYVVVSSSIDGDLAMDYSKKIIKNGTNIKLIQPNEPKKFYRVTVGDYDTWTDAQSAISTLSSNFGSGLWILKY